MVYLDFGNSERVTMDRVRPLDPQFATLPAHAFLCALSEVSTNTESTTCYSCIQT